MGSCCIKSDEIVQPFYKTLSTREVSALLVFHVNCWFCDKRIPHSYVLLEECSNCKIVGHVQCVSTWKAKNSACPKCNFLIKR